MIPPETPKPTKTLPAVFYRTAAGTEAPREELKHKDFDDNDRILIGRDVARVEFGWPGVVGSDTCEKLDGDIYAVRTNLPKNRIARVLFSPHEKSMFILRAFIKKATDGIKTPKHEIDLAKARLTDSKARLAAKARAEKAKKR
jgi:phage-related protein